MDDDEIEVTQEMEEAGAEIVFAFREDVTAWTLAERVYRAMERERARQTKTSPAQ